MIGRGVLHRRLDRRRRAGGRGHCRRKGRGDGHGLRPASCRPRQSLRCYLRKDSLPAGHSMLMAISTTCRRRSSRRHVRRTGAVAPRASKHSQRSSHGNRSRSTRLTADLRALKQRARSVASWTRPRLRCVGEAAHRDARSAPQLTTRTLASVRSSRRIRHEAIGTLYHCAQRQHSHCNHAAKFPTIDSISPALRSVPFNIEGTSYG